LALSILPWALPPYVNGILWKFVFFSGYGFLNKLLLKIGLIHIPIEFLSTRWTLLLVIGIVVVWRSTPFVSLVCLAGRQSIPSELYEAATVDGGHKFAIFRWITVPLMLPFIGVGLTSTSVTAINVFDEIVSLSGYSDLGKNILMESYLTTFEFLNFGKGAATTYIVMLCALVLGVFYIKGLNKEVEY
ncbi:MAG: sugar ABC transporter permease, partial [Lachnospiraceae bacterium]